MLRRPGSVRFQLFLALSLGGLLLLCGRVAADPFTWSGNGGSLNWSTAGNWTGGTPASRGATDLFFEGSTNTGTLASPLNQDLGSPFLLNSLTFNAGAGSFFLGGGALAFGGTTSNTITQSSSSAQSIANAITTSGTKAPTLNLTGNGTGIVTLAGEITPGNKDVGIFKSGSSTFILTGANTYGGATTISAGVLNIQHAQALGTTAGGTNVLSGAALQIQGDIAVGAETMSLSGTGIADTGALRNISGDNSFAGLIVLASATTIGSDAGNLTLTGVISGNFGLTKVGAGTLTLSASNTFTGSVAIQNGMVSVFGSGLGTSTTAIALGDTGTTGTLQYTGGSATSTRTFTLAAGGAGALDISSAATIFTFGTTATISGSGGFIKTGAGTLVLSSAATHTGGTTINAGILRLGASERLSDTGALTITGGTFDLQGFDETVGTLTVSGGGTITGTGTLISSSAAYALQDGTINIALGGDGSVTKTTAGTVTLNSANSYTGATSITAGTLQVNVNDALGTTASGTTVATGGALRLNNVEYSTAERLTLNGSGISNGGALVNVGTSTFAGAITAASHATINAGGGSLTLTGGLIKDGTTLTIAGGGTVHISSTGISGSSPNSDLVVDGTTVVLNAASSYNGPTTVQNSGTLRLGASNVLPVAPQTALTVNSSSALDLAGHSDGIASLAGDNTGTVRNSLTGSTSTLTVNPAAGVTTTFAGAITGTSGGTSGDVALIKSGAGTLVLTGASTFSGSTTITGGTLAVASADGAALASTSSITVHSNGTLLLGASNQVGDSAPVTLAGGTIARGNFNEGSTSSAGFGALTLTASGSSLDFGTGTVGILTFASFTSEENVLVINNWTGLANTIGNAGTDRLIFQTSLSATDLASFSFTGYAEGASQFSLGGGYYEVVPVPEPGTYLAAALALLATGYHQRRRLKQLLRSRKLPLS